MTQQRGPKPWEQTITLAVLTPLAALTIVLADALLQCGIGYAIFIGLLFGLAAGSQSSRRSPWPPW